MATAGDNRGAGAERAYCAPLPETGLVTLGADESRHLVRSRRVAVGERVVLFDGEGGSRFAHLKEADPRGVVLVVDGLAPDREPKVALRMVVSPPEGGRADDLISALAELGVYGLAWTEAARTPARRLESTLRRQERQVRRAREAAKVNGRSRLMGIGSVGGLALWLAQEPEGSVLLLDPDPTCAPLLDVVGTGPLPTLVVGPEGGFTPDEIAAATSRGHQRAQLGTCVLRVATAAQAAAATVLVARG